jgi:hypothetical protein
VRSAFVSKRAPVDRLVQSEAIKLYPGWSKVVGAPLALYEPRTWISDLAPEGGPDTRTSQRPETSLRRDTNAASKSHFRRTVMDSTVDRPDSRFRELAKRLDLPEQVNTGRSLLPFQGATLLGLRQDPGSQRGPWQRRGHPRNRPRRLAYLWVRERLNFAPSVFTGGGHRVVSR